MRFGRLGLIGAAGLLAIGTAVLVQNWLESERASMTPQAAKPAPTVRVLVAKTNIGVGQFVTPDNVKWVAWPDAGVQPTYFIEGKRQVTDAAGSVVRYTLTAGEPITEGKIVQPGDRGFLAAVLQPGMRAVSVQINLTSGISGFVFPGDRVDIVLVHVYKQAADNERERRAGETVLTDVRVLAVDQKTDSKNGEPILGRSVTFEVSSKQAEILALAAEMGKLSLSLRSLASVSGQDEDADRAINSGDVASGKVNQNTNTYTLDSDASRLLAGGKTGSERVTLLRGGSAASAKAAPQ
jgi:pilus assembly protein CpaB